MSTIVRLLGPDDAAVLARVASGVFDHEIDPRWTSEFLADPRHHLAVAVDDGTVVGMASALHYVHPDKPPELWVNEVGVARTHRGRGVGTRLLRVLFEHARTLGCAEAWVLTERANVTAQCLYAGVGGTAAAEDPVMFSFRLRT